MVMLTSVLERTQNLCFYRFNGAVSGYFPHVKTLTLIHCKHMESILKPSVFPNINQIHYLSNSPIETDLHTKVNVSWVFPNLSKPFYSTMIEAGLGRVDESLITQYIHNMTLTDTIEFTLKIPDYGIIRGSDYQEEIGAFFMKNKSPYKGIFHKNIHNNPHNEYYKQVLKRKFMESL